MIRVFIWNCSACPYTKSFPCQKIIQVDDDDYDPEIHTLSEKQRKFCLISDRDTADFVKENHP